MSKSRHEIMPWAEAAWTLFHDRLETDRLAHALLLHGPEGVGKGALAQAMVETLLCLDAGRHGACGACRSCQLLQGGAHPDRFELTFLVDRNGKQKKEILVEQIRSLIGSLGMTTTFSRRKVSLIHPADALNRSAANALLKTLEEPPGETVVILLAHEPARLPVTVRSRCQSLAVPMPARKVAAQWLQERHNLGEEEGRDALRAAAGSPLRALHFHSEGLVPLHRKLNEALQELFSGADRVADVLGLLRELDESTLWLWLSSLCGEWARDRQGERSAIGPLLALQHQADRFRRLAKTPVRGDLLLREWLIEWCRAGAATRS